MTRSSISRRPRVGIIGAGLSGLTCARTLLEHGLEVGIFDKGARPGGRLATRRRGSWEYDHGAQYFTVRDPRFGSMVDSWRREGLVAEWDARIAVFEKNTRRPAPLGTRRLVGVPGMNSIAASIAGSCAVRSGIRIESIAGEKGSWTLAHEHGVEGPYDLVVITVPAPQAIPLLEIAPELQETLSRIRMSGCWAVMAAFPGALDVDFDAAFVNEGPLAWVARNGTKPGRRGETWVLHASPAWTGEQMDRDPGDVAAPMIRSFAALAKTELPPPAHHEAHLWRYALPENPLDDGCLFDSRLGLALGGDWCAGAKIEGAFLSGLEAARRIIDWAGSD